MPKTASEFHVLNEKSLTLKLQRLEGVVHRLLLGQSTETVPLVSARDLEILSPQGLPKKPGLSTQQGKARLMHDLASIELQAMELGLRSLIEYPNAPQQFREEMAELTLNEAEHLRLCLDAIQDNGGEWGETPVHLTLWSAVSSEDTLLDRILIVHRYLEGSGLDAGDTILRRLEGMPLGSAYYTMKQIRDEEIGHVQFGSRWYRELCHQQGIDPEIDFKERMQSFGVRLPKRLEPLSKELRLKAGFTESEIAFLEERRLKFLRPAQ